MLLLFLKSAWYSFFYKVLMACGISPTSPNTRYHIGFACVAQSASAFCRTPTDCNGSHSKQ